MVHTCRVGHVAQKTSTRPRSKLASANMLLLLLRLRSTCWRTTRSPDVQMCQRLQEVSQIGPRAPRSARSARALVVSSRGVERLEMVHFPPVGLSSLWLSMTKMVKLLNHLPGPSKTCLFGPGSQPPWSSSSRLRGKKRSFRSFTQGALFESPDLVCKNQSSKVSQTGRGVVSSSFSSTW